VDGWSPGLVWYRVRRRTPGRIAWGCLAGREPLTLDGSMRVLVVDDASSVRQRIVAMLGQAAEVEAVYEAETGEEALVLLDRFAPDLMTLDLMLPGMGGLEVLEEVRRREAPVDVVVVTNYPYPAFKKKCLDLGANHFFPKNTGARQILELLRNGALKHCEAAAREGTGG
jgi:DNA-binding NarL/FixJ family response regulator